MTRGDWTGGNGRLSKDEVETLYAARAALGRGLWVGKWTEGRGHAYNALNAYIENLEKFLLAGDSGDMMTEERPVGNPEGQA